VLQKRDLRPKKRPFLSHIKRNIRKRGAMGGDPQPDRMVGKYTSGGCRNGTRYYRVARKDNNKATIIRGQVIIWDAGAQYRIGQSDGRANVMLLGLTPFARTDYL
jgi:hypothetical protein